MTPGGGTTARRRAGAVALLIGASVLLTACIGNPAPPTASAPGHRDVLLVGDSLLSQAAPHLPAALAIRGLDATVHDRSAPGAGLLDPGYVDAMIAAVTANPQIDIVVVEFTGNCFGCPVFATPEEFRAAWFAEAQRLVDAIHARGRHVVWVAPGPADPALPFAATLIDLSVHGYWFAARNHLVVVNWIEAFTDTTGAYQRTLWYGDLFEAPAWHTVRSDGLHFTVDGERRAATWLVAGIRAAWDLPAPTP